MNITSKVSEFANFVRAHLNGTKPRANAGKKLNVAIGNVILVQYPNEDIIGIEMSEAPSPFPTEPDEVPYLVVVVAPGFGKDWLKKATGLQPDEIIEG